MPLDTQPLDTLKLKTLVIERPSEQVAILRLNRPERMNAMTVTMFHELEASALTLHDDDELRVLIITGTGSAFCAGYDLDDAEELAGISVTEMLERQELAARALLAVRSLRVPVIAAVNGAVAGGGFALALAADIRLAAPQAKFSAGFVRIGLSAGDLGVSWLLPRMIGPAAAAEIAYTGRLVLADEAEQLGLVNRVTDNLLDDALAMAAQICANAPTAVQLSKTALQANMEIGSYAAAIELENRGQALLTRTQDMVEALDAFRTKRPAQFTGR